MNEMANDYAHESELNDMKQHADKIIQGIKKLEPSDANRAIWELFQNAVDLSENCEIEIELTEEFLRFSHNGKPFTTLMLDCLFKQVSSKTLEEKKIEIKPGDPVGQYGTGFLTTHSFGKIVSISGDLETRNGYINFSDFKIDRDTQNWRELAERIGSLKKEVYNILANGTPKDHASKATSFTYFTSTDSQKEKAKVSIKALHDILPYVMVFNEKLKRVTVATFDKTITIFEKLGTSKTGLALETQISIGPDIKYIYSIKDDKDRYHIILPLIRGNEAIDFSDDIPKLFLYYPMIGTECFGFNYLVHSRFFRPTEPRDAIHLISDNEDNKEEEEANQEILTEISEAIFNFVKNNSGVNNINNPLKLAKINFPTTSGNELLNDYFSTLKEKWIKNFSQYEIVETNAGNLPASEAIFLDSELIKEEGDAYDAIYSLAAMFWPNLPVKEASKEWTAIVDNWEVSKIETINWNKISLKIEEVGNLNGFENVELLTNYYKCLIKNNLGGHFSTNSLIPNIKGEFKQLGFLRASVNIDDYLIKIADTIMPEISKKQINPSYNFSFELESYTRKHFITDINASLDDFLKDATTSADIDAAYFEAFLDYCKLTTIIEPNSVSSKLSRLICEYYEYSTKFISIIPDKDNELDLRPAHRKLVRIFLRDIANEDVEWVKDKVDSFIKDVISLGSAHDTFKELFITMPAFPNQLFEIVKQGTLEIDENISEEIKDLYDDVVNPPMPIRGILAHHSVEEFLENKEKRTAQNLVDEIEGAFFPSEQAFDITSHPFKPQIISTIEHMTPGSEWEKLFRLLSNKRANIMLDMVTGENTKTHIFSIVKLGDEKISILGKLVADKNFERIIELGQLALDDERQDNANFQHKKTIGNHLEKVLRARLKDKLEFTITSPQIRDEQNGQDIIISVNNEPIYYIEVKSRWDVKSSIRMSKNQTLKAFTEQENYALCTIDMTKYLGEDRYEVNDISKIAQFITFDNKIGEKLGHLIDPLKQMDQTEEVHLDGDIRTLIPMKIIDMGSSLEEFEDFLVGSLKQAHAIPN